MTAPANDVIEQFGVAALDTMLVAAEPYFKSLETARRSHHRRCEPVVCTMAMMPPAHGRERRDPVWS